MTYQECSEWVIYIYDIIQKPVQQTINQNTWISSITRWFRGEKCDILDIV